MQFSISKYLNEPGSFYVYQTQKFVNVLAVSTYSDKITFSDPGTSVKRLISYSTDEINWTAWEPITHTTAIPATDVLYIKIMWKLLTNPSYEFVDIIEFSLDIKQELCADESKDFVAQNSIFTTVGDSVGEFEKTLNMLMNESIAGIPVDYYRTLPDSNSKDVMLNEYSIHGVVECKRINVVAENLPDLIPEFNDYSAVTFDKFELFIDYEYFKKAFGKNTKPRIEDRIYLPIYNILYYVHSVYLSPGIRERSLTWVLSLLIHDETANMKTDEHLDNFKNMTLSKEDLFAEEMLAEMNNAKQIDQVKKTKKTGKELFISDKLSFITEKLTSNSHIVATNYYKITGTDTPMVRYKHIGKPKENLAICHLFRYRESCVMIHDDGTNTISIAANILYVRNQPGPTLIPNKWYGIVINFYDTNCEVNIWEFKSVFRSKEDTTMNLVSTQFLNVKKFYPGQIMLGAGDYDFANLRIWKMPVPMEYQSFVLTQSFVEKPDKCYLIDNCDPENRLWNYSQDITA